MRRRQTAVYRHPARACCPFALWRASCSSETTPSAFSLGTFFLSAARHPSAPASLETAVSQFWEAWRSVASPFMEPRSLSHAAREKNSQLKRNSAETWLKGRDVEAARESSSRDADSDEGDSVPVEESRMEQCVFPSRSPHPCFDPFVHETASLQCVRPLLFETRDALHLRGVPDLRRTARRSSRKVERDGPRETAPRFRSGPPSRRGREESTGEEDGMASKANRKRGCVSLQSQRGRKVGKSRRQVRRNLLRRLKRSRRGGNELHNPPTQEAQGDVNRGSGSARAVLFTLDQVGCDVDAREQLLPRREREKPSFHGEAAATSREALNGEKNDAPRPSKVRCKK
ncbi:hypothetical protein TGP89_419460 [Toxoplasma gondii p89]|uniref:Uncharacterized protein n=1 Tax=Toxoplasma gondii p89 TaxID=943119 RepID=A0A086KCE0_TOXGO|nr:hypothetical protein TGP89_419460 [Toxoplasma gondii p89]